MCGEDAALSQPTHSDRHSFERGRLKDAQALAAGHATVRIIDQRLKRGGAAEAERIRTIVAARSDSPERD